MTRLRAVTEGESSADPMVEAAQAAITTALAEGMTCGVLIYETIGGVGRAPICAGIASVRGLLEMARDDLMADGE